MGPAASYDILFKIQCGAILCALFSIDFFFHSIYLPSITYPTLFRHLSSSLSPSLSLYVPWYNSRFRGGSVYFTLNNATLSHIKLIFPYNLKAYYSPCDICYVMYQIGLFIILGHVRNEVWRTVQIFKEIKAFYWSYSDWNDFDVCMYCFQGKIRVEKSPEEPDGDGDIFEEDFAPHNGHVNALVIDQRTR